MHQNQVLCGNDLNKDKPLSLCILYIIIVGKFIDFLTIMSCSVHFQFLTA